MIIKCGIGDEELNNISFSLCHHCGMPVCEDHGWFVSADDAFAGVIEAVSALPQHSPVPSAPSPGPLQRVIAMMRQVKSLVRQAKSMLRQAKSMVRPVVEQPQAAMHCRDCLEKHHGKSAGRRRKWADIPLVGQGPKVPA